jgi:hypothetical protein
MRRRDGEAVLTPAAIRDLEELDRALAGQALDGEYADLELLVRAVRDDAPRIDPAFGAQLEQRVAEGFPRRGREARLRSIVALSTRRHGLLAIGTGLSAVVAAAVILVVAGGGHRQGAPVVTPLAGRPAVTAAGGAASAAPAQVPSPRAGATLVPAPPPGGATSAGVPTRAVERDAELTLSAPRGQLQRTSDRVVAVTDRFGGIVQSSNVSVDDQGGSQAQFQLQIPTAKLDTALAAYSALAHVSSRSESTLDITDPTRAAGNRLAEAQAERLALLRQLAKATTPNQVASIHAQLGLVAGRIQQDDQDLRSLQRRASYATLQLTVTEGRNASSGGGGTGTWGPGDAANSALDVLRATLGVLLVAAASLVPLALLALPAWSAAVALRRRRREQALGPLV